MNRHSQKKLSAFAILAAFALSSCAAVNAPNARSVNIPSPTMADTRSPGINERPDSVMYLPLGEDILVPEVVGGEDFPKDTVGPFELRGETLAGALQLILADYDISIAFETQEGLTRRITVANLRGELGKVVNQLCSLANLYCAYEDGTITIKDRQTFTVALPPLGSGEDSTAYMSDVAEGLGAILNEGSSSQSGSTTTSSAPIVDTSTRTIIYSATQRTADIASRYFQRLRANTAMIVFETYIWEVSLTSGNSMGVDWSRMLQFSKFNSGISINGTIGADFTNPVSIGIPTAAEFTGTSGDLFQFLSQFGAVKTISQPQITVLSGSQAELRVADTQNYVSQIATTLSEGQATTSVNTDSVDTGFTLSIGSSWDKSTVYANVEIELTDVKQIDNFAFSDEGGEDPDDPDAEPSGTRTRIQLPQTSERQLSTQIRVRPGDSVLIAGLVRENDNFDKRGIGLMDPILPDSRTAQAENLELVILLRPRVIVYTAANDKRYVDYAMKKHKLPGTGVETRSAMELSEPAEYTNRYVAPAGRSVTAEQEMIPSGMPAALTPEPMSAPIAPSDPVPVLKSVAPPPPAPDPVVMKTEPAPPPVAKPAALTPVAPVPLAEPAGPTPVVQPMPGEPAVTIPGRTSRSMPAPAPVIPPPPSSSELDAPSDAARVQRGSGFSSSEYARTPAGSSQSSAPASATGASSSKVPAYETYDQYAPSP